MPRKGTRATDQGSIKGGRIQVWAGYTFGGLSIPGNGSSDAILPIVECHSAEACIGGETSNQCFPGYVDTRSAAKEASPMCHAAVVHSCRTLAILLITRNIWAFGCRCGTCDVGYYSVSGQCRVCGDASLVFFLSRAVPALGVTIITGFFFWGGTLSFAVPEAHSPAYVILCGTTKVTPYLYGGCAAHSGSRLLVMVPFLDTVSLVAKHSTAALLRWRPGNPALRIAAAGFGYVGHFISHLVSFACSNCNKCCESGQPRPGMQRCGRCQRANEHELVS